MRQQQQRQTAVPLGAQATAAAPIAAEAATRPVDLDEGDERSIGVLQRLNTAPVTTAAAVAAPGDGGRGRGRGWGRGRGARAVCVYSRRIRDVFLHVNIIISVLFESI